MVDGGCGDWWSPDELANVLRQARGYNEVIVGREALAQLPGVIEAIVFIECSTTLPSPQYPASERWSFCQGRRDNGFSGVAQLDESVAAGAGHHERLVLVVARVHRRHSDRLRARTEVHAVAARARVDGCR